MIFNQQHCGLKLPTSCEDCTLQVYQAKTFEVCSLKENEKTMSKDTVAKVLQTIYHKKR